MIENQSRWIEVEGGKVHYLIEGTEKGRPVVLLHGASFLFGDLEADRHDDGARPGGYLVYAMDLPGYGSRRHRSGRTRPGCGSFSTCSRSTVLWSSRRR